MKKRIIYCLIISTMIMTGCSKGTSEKQNPNDVSMTLDNTNTVESIETTNVYNENDEETYPVVDDGTSEELEISNNRVTFQTNGDKARPKSSDTSNTTSDVPAAEATTEEDSLLSDAKRNISNIRLNDNYAFTYIDPYDSVTYEQYGLMTGEEYVKFENQYGSLDYTTKATNKNNVGIYIEYSDTSIKTIDGTCDKTDFKLPSYLPSVAQIDSVTKHGNDLDIDCDVYFYQTRRTCKLRTTTDYVIKEITCSDPNITVSVNTVLALKKNYLDYNQIKYKSDEINNAVQLFMGQQTSTPKQTETEPSETGNSSQDTTSETQPTSSDSIHGTSKTETKTEFEFDEEGGIKYVIVNKVTKYSDGCVSIKKIIKSPTGETIDETIDDSGMQNHDGLQTPPKGNNTIVNSDDYITVKGTTVTASYKLDENVGYDDVKETLYIQLYGKASIDYSDFIIVDGINGYMMTNDDVSCTISLDTSSDKGISNAKEILKKVESISYAQIVDPNSVY